MIRPLTKRKHMPHHENVISSKTAHLEKNKEKICSNFDQIAFMGIDFRVATGEYPKTWESSHKGLYIR